MDGMQADRNEIYKGSLEDFLAHSGTDPQSGLTSEEAAARLAALGPNVLREKAKRPFFMKILDQFKDFMVIILIIASVVSGFLGEWVDALVIIAIVIVNAILGVFQEGKAEKAIEALRRMSAPNARVIRDGRQQEIPASEVVPGDLCVLEAGDIVPADIRLTESASLKAEEASLTGESVPVDKSAGTRIDGDVPIGDRANLCFMSTAVTYGRGRGIAAATGSHSEIGSIADRLQDIDNDPTPLQKNLNQLGKWLGIICLAVCAVVFATDIMEGGDPMESFMTAVALAVAAIPEGLPAVVTIVLALGMKRLADKNAIMKRLLAVETLGSVDVICSDKTGTLTQNAMTVTRLWCGGGIYRLTGSGYDPSGELLNLRDEWVPAEEGSPLELLFRIGALCNDASMTEDGQGGFGILGDPTEGALTVAAAKAGFPAADLNRQFVRVGELPFDSDRKMMTTFHYGIRRDDVMTSCTKGAPDVILAGCDSILAPDGAAPLTEDMRREILRVNSEFASSALRVLAFSFQEKADEVSPAAESGMTFVGLMGMIDPERPEARDAIALCARAGIRPVMITGDYRDTAVAIAGNLGMMPEDAGVMTGPEIDRTSDEDLLRAVERTTVYARVSPEHKVRIVTALRANGHVASMTGDGVNDAMALKRADIGVAMGITGTEVAKGTADMILTDDNFATIVSAVREGRIIYSNIRKFVGFLLSCNVGEILVIFITTMILGPAFSPLLPIQLLWLNLVTDSFPALALGGEAGEKDIMEEPPRRSGEPIIDGRMAGAILTQSAAIFAAVFAAFATGRHLYPDIAAAGGAAGPSMHARTFAFVTLICAELLRAFSSRSEHASVFRLGFFRNRALTWATALSLGLVFAVVYIPFLQPVFRTVSLSPRDWGMILGFILIPFVAGEGYKAVLRAVRRHRKH